MKLLEKLREIIIGRTIWEKFEEVFDDEIVKELKRAKILKEFADRTGLPVIIDVPQLNIRYTYDPLDRKFKEKKLKLIELLIKRETEKLRERELKKLISQIE